MKQTGLSGVLKSFLAVAFLSLFTLAATSCDNFLQAGDLKQQLDEAIEIANSNPVTYFVFVDEGTGSVNPASVLVRKKDTFEIIFTLSENYNFECWEVLDRKTGKPVTGSLQFENSMSLETKVTVINPIEGLVIHPKCFKSPAVTQIIPSPFGQNQINTTIQIKFNMPVDESVVDKVKLSCIGTDMSDYFNKPVLNDAKDMVLITPKVSLLKNYISGLQKGSVDINVYLPDTITGIINGKEIPLKQNENTYFNFHYILVSDATPPSQIDYCISRDYVAPCPDISTLTRFHDDIFLVGDEINGQIATENLVADQDDKLLDNLCGPYVYIYGKLKDQESGISKITVSEQHCGDYNLKLIGNKVFAKEYQTDILYAQEEDETGTWFYTDSDGTVTFCIKHYLVSKDGAVRIYVSASDSYDHTINMSSVIPVIKLAYIAMDVPGWFMISNTYHNDKYTLTKNQIHSLLKTVNLWVDQYDQLFIPYTWIEIPDSLYSTECEYEHSDGEVKIDPLTHIGTYEWSINLDVKKLSGLNIKFKIKDILGNCVVKEYQIPKSEDYIGVQQPNASDNNKADIHFLYKTGEFACEPIPLRVNGDDTFKYGSNDNWYLIYGEYTATMEKDTTYKFIPCAGFEFDYSSTVRFYTEIPDYTYTVQSAAANTETVTVENYDTGLQYNIKKNSIGDLLDVSVKISSDSWTKGFDNIILEAKENAFIIGQYNHDDNYYGWVQPGDKYVLFEKNKPECVVTLLTALLYQSDTTELYVYGVKNGVNSPKTNISIPKLTVSDKIYDNYMHYDFDGNISDISSDFMEATFKDDQTGVNTLKTRIFEGVDIFDVYGTDISERIKAIEDSGRTVCGTNETGNLYSRTITFPRWMYTDTGFTWYFTDNGGNVRCGVVMPNQFKQLFKIQSMVKGTNSITVNVNRVVEDSIRPKKALIYTWDSTKNEWNNLKEKSYPDGYFSDYSITLTKGTHYTADTFIKVSICSPRENYDQKYSHYSYIYTGASSSNPEIENWVDGPFAGKVKVTSSAPVFARTVVTTATYEECKNWTTAQWEDGRKCIRERLLPCSASKPEQYYKVWDPADSYGIDHARCYAVIIHFADGSREKGPVFENPYYFEEK
ncbi:MAG: hypothetical protein IK102_10375 [Treponema sp.]|nr:hypothetical protein [Treponema sp.]